MLFTIPIGSILLGWCVLMAVKPIRRPRRVAIASWIASCVHNELPFIFLYVVAASAIPAVIDGGLTSPGDWISFALSLLTAVGLVIIARRSLPTGAAVDRALDHALGPGWRYDLPAGVTGRPRRHLPWLRILLFPWPWRPRAVERVANIAYGDNGSNNLLDVYRHRSRPSDAPTLIYFHGGGFRWGRKNWEARPLIYHLAGQGWTCISANSHLASTPSQGFPEHLIDVKKVIAWARTHARDHGIDPDTIFLAGSSSGAHLTAMAAFTVNDPAFQPGFEAADTSITAGIGLYGYYGPLSDQHPSSTPLSHVGPDAPPMFLIHGDNDTYALVEGARELVQCLRSTSSQPVVYAELPGAQHSFDLFHSIRFETVIDAIEAFAASVRARKPCANRRESGAREPLTIMGAAGSSR